MTEHEINERIALEHEVIAYLIKTARAAGFLPIEVWDGGDFVDAHFDAEMMAAVFSVDESTAYFKHPDQPKGHCAFIVLGNDGYDAICDNSVGPGWDEVIAAVEDRFWPKDDEVQSRQVDKLAVAISQLEITQTNLNKGMSKSIQKLMAKSIGEVLEDLK